MSTKPAPSTVDAVAGALGVELTDADRATYQLEAEQRADTPPAGDPPQDPPGGQDPPQDPPAGGTTPPEPKPAAKPGDATPGDDTPKPLTAEEVAKALDPAPPSDPKDAKTGDALLDDPIADEVQGRTRTRMEQLLTRGREQHAQLTDAQAELEDLRPLAEQGQGWHRIIEGSGLAPEEFATVMGTMAAINVGTPDQKRVALAKIDEFRSKILKDLGEPGDGADPLADFPDLRGQVNNLEIPLATAVELAKSRRDARAAQTVASQREAQERAQRERQTAIATAETELNTLGTQLLQRDGQDAFMVRRHIAFKALQGVAKNLHPTAWRQAFLDAYAATPQSVVDNTIASLRKPTTPTPRRNTPVMQGGGGGMGGAGGNGGAPSAQPKTAQDAVFAALGLAAPTE